MHTLRAIDPEKPRGAQNSALDFVEELHSYRTTEELTSGLLRHVSHYGIQTATLVRLGEPGRPVAPTFMFGKGDPEWGQAYLEMGAYRMDPAVPAIFDQARPFFWSDMVASGLPRCGQAVFGLAADFGHRDALNVPVIDRRASVSTVIMTSPSPLQLNAGDRTILTLVGTAFAQQGIELTSTPSALCAPLTRREAQCLAWVADGKSDWAISEILSIAQPTVHMHVENARRKLGCRTRFQAVTEAWRRGWLSAPEK